jgi:hypothetical protein
MVKSDCGHAMVNYRINKTIKVTRGKLGKLGAFGDLSESVGSRTSNDGFGSLSGIKFAHDCHCHEQQIGPKTELDCLNLGMKKSSIGGKQYLDSLQEPCSS